MRIQQTDAPTTQHAHLTAEFATERISFDDAVTICKAGIERDAAYAAALELVRRIEPSPNSNGSWCVGGVWYHSLGAVVRAILAEGER